MYEVKAPDEIPTKARRLPSVFLAGSIEMGAAENWQERVAKFFAKSNVLLFNPRRDDWDSSWEQDISNPEFKEQVTWELNMIDYADLVLMYFDPSAKSPVSMLELGYLAESDRVIVVCPQGFWRKGNVDILCERENIPLYETLDEALQKIKGDLNL